MTIRTASIKTLAAAAALAGAASLACAVSAADLEVHVDGLRSAEGEVRVALHRQTPGAKAVGDAGVVGASFRAAAPGTVRFVFPDVGPGAYAVAAFHDADGDGDLATNFLGMPTEGYGFSNGATGFMGPPSFEDAAVSVGEGDAVLSVSVAIAYPETPAQGTER